jgi:hypothetical protein
MTNVDLLEEAALGDELTGRKWKVRLIEGDKLGSTAYYPAETLLRDGPRIFRKGTPMYLNHQTAEERINRPFGSVQEFAGELSEDAYYDGDGLYANIEVFEHHAPMIKGLRDKIGISIRATARTVTETINGKSVPVAKELIKARSADFVVKAGAGGKLVTILESATDTEEDSSVKEEGLVMDEATKELLEGLKAAFTSQSKALTDLTESLKPVEKEQKVEETAAVNPLEVAKELAAAELSEAATERVLERFEANKGSKTLAELIESEKAYLSANKTAETIGVEESEKKTEVTEVTESAIHMPSRWASKSKESN